MLGLKERLQEVTTLDDFKLLGVCRPLVLSGVIMNEKENRWKTMERKRWIGKDGGENMEGRDMEGRDMEEKAMNVSHIHGNPADQSQVGGRQHGGSQADGGSADGSRVWEIDFVRAIAIIFMVIFHLLFDLKEYLDLDIPYWDSLIVYISNGVVFFMFISAISSGFSKRPVQRGALVFAIGMGITLVTYLLMPDSYVRFGILHFLGVSMMLFPGLKKLSNGVLLGLAIFSLIIGVIFMDMRVDTWVLLPLGLRYSGFNSIDYYPLFPYLSASILGVIAYKKWYFRRQSILPFIWDFKSIRWISKHSLAIYLLHQPIIVGILYLIKGPFGL